MFNISEHQVKIQTVLIFHLIQEKMAVINKSNNSKCFFGFSETRILYIGGENAMYKQFGDFSKN